MVLFEVIMNQQNSVIEIVEASLAHADALTPLFVAYREFYRNPPEFERSHVFIRQRLAQRDSVIFLAWLKEEGKQEAAGFVQLFPSFSTGTMKRIWILNDLFVAPAVRRKGVGSMLMERARRYAVETQASRLTLKTEVTNHQAQALYESLGWKRDERFFSYDLTV